MSVGVRVLRGICSLIVLLGLLQGWSSTSTAHAGPVAMATLQPSSPVAPADGVTAVTLVATVQDSAGVGVPGVFVRLATDHPASVVTQPLTSTNVLGRATGTITSTAEGRATIDLLDATTGTVLTTTQVIFLSVPDPARSSLTASVAGQGGVSTATVTITVRDYQGQPVVERPLRVTTGTAVNGIGQPLPTNSQGNTTATVSFTGTASVVTVTDVPTGITLGSITVQAPVPAGTSTIHAILKPAAARMGNGTDRVPVRITLLDGHNQPLSGKKVALHLSAAFADPGASAVTDRTGQATLAVGIRGPYRHFGTAAGPVLITAVDITDAQPLTATAQLLVYNRVAVLLRGFGTSLSCTLQACYDREFSQISADALAPLGYNLNGDGVHRTELEYSYRGGTMVRMANGTWQWLITPYGVCDTAQPLERDEQALRALLQSYRTRYPYTTFELLAHSLGGTVALEGLAGDGGTFLRSLGPAAVDKIITIDSPVNGIDQHYGINLLSLLIGGASELRLCSGQLFGTYLVAQLNRIGRSAPGLQERWVATLRKAEAEVLTITNRDDAIVPERYAIIDDGQGHHVTDRIRYALGRDRLEGHGDLLTRKLSNGKPNPVWPNFISAIQGYLSNPCLPVAPNSAACLYPSINRGF